MYIYQCKLYIYISLLSLGKELGRMARLAQIADNLGIADARQQALQVFTSHSFQLGCSVLFINFI
jgi:hypothetical protein